MNVRELIEKLKYFSDDTLVMYVSARDKRHDIDIVRAEREYVWDYETRYHRYFDSGNTIVVLGMSDIEITDPSLAAKRSQRKPQHIQAV